MANVIKKIRTIDEETGEIYYERSFKSYDGWNDKGYRYRGRYNAIKFYPDNMVQLEPNITKIFFLICHIMNEDNLLVTVKKGSKYVGPEVTPYTVEEIRENLPYKVSEYSFKKAWKALVPNYIKKIKFEGKKIWAVNPAFANRCIYVPPFLWENFKTDMNKFLTKSNITRYNNMYLTDGI